MANEQMTNDLRPGCTLTLSECDVRARQWLFVFGRLCDIPITGYLPQHARLPGMGKELVYLLDLARVTPDERARLVSVIAERFDMDEAEVELNLDASGCPILAEGVMVAIPLRLMI